MKSLAFSLSACLLSVLVSNAANAKPGDNHYVEETIWERVTRTTGDRLRRDYRNTSRRAILGNASRLMDRLEPNGRSVGRRNEILRELVMGNAYRDTDDVDRVIRSTFPRN